MPKEVRPRPEERRLHLRDPSLGHASKEAEEREGIGEGGPLRKANLKHRCAVGRRGTLDREGEQSGSDELVGPRVQRTGAAMAVRVRVGRVRRVRGVYREVVPAQPAAEGEREVVGNDDGDAPGSDGFVGAA